MPSKLDQPKRRAFDLRRHFTVPITATEVTVAATCSGPAVSHEMAADEKAEATAVGLGTADAQWPKAGMQTRSSHRKAPSAFV